MTIDKKRILPQIVLLRALASLSVCVFHLGCGNGKLFPNTNLLKQILRYGYEGVPVFFLISGFIICYAMPDHYELRDFKTFAAKRMVRIYPPYVVSVLLVIALLLVSSFFNGHPFQFSGMNVLYHLSYLTNFKLGRYLNIVYWTLGIEIQFYILIGLLFHFMKQSEWTVALSCMLLLAASFIPAHRYHVILPFLPVFCLGIASYFFLCARLLRPVTFIAISLACCLLIYPLGLPALFACLIASAVLFFWKREYAVLRFLSRISYSLYLVHVTIGGRCVNLGLRFFRTDFQHYLLFCIALTVSVIFACYFEKYVEKPCLSFSRRISYRLR